MKNLLIACLLVGASLPAFAQKPQHFGANISDKEAIPAVALAAQMEGKTSMPAKVEGTVESVCQMKGCWATVKLADGQTMRVTFKDYAFFVPKDIAGKTIVMDGTAMVKTTSVALLQHYAEDAGKSKEEVAKITQPEKALAFEATGVVIK